jgi:hypothetical protein
MVLSGCGFHVKIILLCVWIFRWWMELLMVNVYMMWLKLKMVKSVQYWFTPPLSIGKYSNRDMSTSSSPRYQEEYLNIWPLQMSIPKHLPLILSIRKYKNVAIVYNLNKINTKCRHHSKHMMNIKSIFHSQPPYTSWSCHTSLGSRRIHIIIMGHFTRWEVSPLIYLLPILVDHQIALVDIGFPMEV